MKVRRIAYTNRRVYGIPYAPPMEFDNQENSDVLYRKAEKGKSSCIHHALRDEFPHQGPNAGSTK